MKATDLMINDWVCLEYPRRVQEINADYIIVNGKIEFDTVGYDEGLEPIPITPEILEKNGFEEKTESEPYVYYLFKDGDNSVSLEHTYDTTDKEDYWACSIGNRLCDVCTISMHYVHELQHALRLCGCEELADNFKVE